MPKLKYPTIRIDKKEINCENQQAHRTLAFMGGTEDGVALIFCISRFASLWIL